MAASSWGIKATFVPTTQDETAVLTKGLGSHRTDDFRAFLENKELPPAITSVSSRHSKEARVTALPPVRHRERLGAWEQEQPNLNPRPAQAHTSHPTCPWMPLLRHSRGSLYSSGGCPAQVSLPAHPCSDCPILLKPSLSAALRVPPRWLLGTPPECHPSAAGCTPFLPVTEGLPEARVPLG